MKTEKNMCQILKVGFESFCFHFYFGIVVQTSGWNKVQYFLSSKTTLCLQKYSNKKLYKTYRLKSAKHNQANFLYGDPHYLCELKNTNQEAQLKCCRHRKRCMCSWEKLVTWSDKNEDIWKSVWVDFSMHIYFPFYQGIYFYMRFMPLMYWKIWTYYLIVNSV